MMPWTATMHDHLTRAMQLEGLHRKRVFFAWLSQRKVKRVQKIVKLLISQLLGHFEF
jgi:hypothetical protein